MKNFEFLEKSPYFEHLHKGIFSSEYEFTKRCSDGIHEIASIMIPKNTDRINWYIVKEKEGKVLYDKTSRTHFPEDTPEWFCELVLLSEERKTKRDKLRKLFK